MSAFIDWIKTNLPSDPSSGEARKDPPQSLSGMVSTLVPVIVVSAIYMIIFLLLRRSHSRFYAPRTYLGSIRENERSPELSGGLFGWFGTFWKIPDAYALQHQSLDAYLFIRYLRVCCTICFVSLCITWPILFPVNATGGGGQEQLEILSYSNIDIKMQKNRLYAHVFVAYLVYGFLMYTILRECIFYINVRQAFLLSPTYSKRISSKTVLFTSVPEDFLDEARIRNLFNDSVKNVWLVGDATELEKTVKERDDVAMKLEKGEVKLLKLVNKERNNAIKKGGQEAEKSPTTNDPESGSVAARWIPKNKRPSHRLGPLGLIGKKVDTIEWGREELTTLIPKAEAEQVEFLSGKAKKAPAVFVEFHTQSDAQAAFQTVAHHQALRMSPRYIGVKPNEVVWSSLFIPWWQLFVRRYIVYGFIAVMIIFWAVPVGIVGIISQVSTLQKLPGLTWISDIPSSILGVISGLLPSVALAILMSLVPVIMRLCAKKAGVVSVSEAELFTQNAYFVFQVVQVFLIRTITDTAAGAIVDIVQDPGSVFEVLSSSLPTSSNFYISYFIVQGLTVATSVLTQVVGCFIFRIMYKFLAGTPRAMYTKWTTLSSLSWGSLLPVYTNIAVISVTYSVIAPLMLFWSSLGMGLFYLAYRYNILFVTDTVIDTHGLIYPRALKQLFVGIYLAEICMIGLFVVSKAAGPAVLMVLFLVFTILYQITISKALDPLLYSLPRSLEVEEEAIQRSQQNSDVENTPVTTNNGETKGNVLNKLVPGGIVGVQKQGNFVMKFLKPWIYADYATLRQLVPQDQSAAIDHQYTPEIENNAYWHPAATSLAPVLWIPEDPAGASKQEVALTSRVIPITDEGCSLDEKNNIVWDTVGARPPIWTEKIYY
ncbi:phosphate metabolism protein 7 [Neonectria punicea]|uniref:Phosphate metabolism protein 7 n=1 Tax=Neonectria punicea TaxID=979145 RepID=A0ABR1HFU7_9HYPO